MLSNARFMLVRPLTLPDFWIELMRPRTVASSKRLGSITVAVNRSPTRESLLDSVSLMRTFRFVPTGTSRVGVVVFFFVCALATGDALTSAMMARRTIRMGDIFLIGLLPQKLPAHGPLSR